MRLTYLSVDPFCSTGIFHGVSRVVQNSTRSSTALSFIALDYILGFHLVTLLALYNVNKTTLKVTI